MIYQNIEFLNVSELEEVAGMSGLRLQRFPKDVRNQLGIDTFEKGRIVSERSNGCEIRFVTDANFIRINLSSLEPDGKIMVYKGDFLHSTHEIKMGVVTAIHLEEPERFNLVNNDCLNGHYSHLVWRIICSNNSCILFHNLDTFGHMVRVPFPNEVPRLKWLAYGSSITAGSSARCYTNTYVAHTAKRLGIDVLNKGLSGACFLEKATADYLATEDWDFITLELGVNVRERYSNKEFLARVEYLLDTLLSKNKPVIVMSIFPNYANYSNDQLSTRVLHNQSFCRILQEIIEKKNQKNLHFIDGASILTEFTGLTVDLLHPSDYGHLLMGENLSRILKLLIRI